MTKLSLPRVRRKPHHDKHGKDWWWPRDNNAALGKRAYFCGVVVRGEMDMGRWRDFLRELIAAIGMTPFADPQCWTWPVTKTGPNGSILVQPITESFIALDVWPDFGGAYLFVCSCKPFAAEPLYQVIDEFGLVPGEEIGDSLSIGNE